MRHDISSCWCLPASGSKEADTLLRTALQPCCPAEKSNKIEQQGLSRRWSFSPSQQTLVAQLFPVAQGSDSSFPRLCPCATPIEHEKVPRFWQLFPYAYGSDLWQGIPEWDFCPSIMRSLVINKGAFWGRIPAVPEILPPQRWFFPAHRFSLRRKEKGCFYHPGIFSCSSWRFRFTLRSG